MQHDNQVNKRVVMRLWENSERGTIGLGNKKLKAKWLMSNQTFPLNYVHTYTFPTDYDKRSTHSHKNSHWKWVNTMSMSNTLVHKLFFLPNRDNLFSPFFPFFPFFEIKWAISIVEHNITQIPSSHNEKQPIQPGGENLINKSIHPFTTLKGQKSTTKVLHT